MNIISTMNIKVVYPTAIVDSNELNEHSLWGEKLWMLFSPLTLLCIVNQYVDGQWLLK